MNKGMAIAMIVVGVLLVVFGIVSLSKGEKQEKAEPQVIVVQTPAPAQPAAAAPVAATAPSTAEAQPTAEDDAKTKGNNFEAYVVDVFKHGNKFRILEWHQGATTPNGNYAEDELNPDLKIALPRDGGSDIDFWVECKYRSSIGNGFQLPKYQLERYKSHQSVTHRKVLVALGLGGESTKPASLYVIPVDSIKDDTPMTEASLANFRIANPHADIRTYIGDYFYQHVFKRSKKH